jgi:mannan endo-1,4-beta-mannosidase
MQTANQALEQDEVVAKGRTQTTYPTMQTAGRWLIDSCGNFFTARGVEQIFGNQLPDGNDWVGLLEQIAASGANAVRILAGTNTLGVDDVDALLEVVADHHMVAYVTPYGNEGDNWLSRPEVRAMLTKHEQYILIDAFGEPTFDDRARFLSEATAALQRVRSWGYRVPLTVTANQFGRDLPSVLQLGAQIVAADPLHNTVLGWQAYWSDTGYYQQTYGLSTTEGVEAAANADFPIQLGLDRVTDFPSEVTADFGALLSATQANSIGWLWWDWYNPYGNENNLSQDGSATGLTATGRTVVTSHAASIRNTAAKRACRPAWR